MLQGPLSVFTLGGVKTGAGPAQDSYGGAAVHWLVKVLVTSGSSVSIGFGLWHLFVPRIWRWYSYIDSSATELVLAVRAINAFFSLSLVQFGLLNVLFVCGGKANRYSIIVLLAATSMLWLTRVVLQCVYPQGSIRPVLQYGMLSLFVLVTLCYTVSLYIVATAKTGF